MTDFLNLFLSTSGSHSVSISIDTGGSFMNFFLIGLVVIIIAGVLWLIGLGIRFVLTCAAVGLVFTIFAPLISSVFDFLASLLCFNMSAVDLGLFVAKIPQLFMFC